MIVQTKDDTQTQMAVQSIWFWLSYRNLGFVSVASAPQCPSKSFSACHL